MRVLVTGASSGIGAATAQRLAADGHTVAVHHHSGRDRAERVLTALPGSGHCLVGGDLADPAAVPGVLTAAVGGLGGLDILVSNAGVYADHPIADTGYDDWQAAWRRTVDVNTIGPANLAWAVVDHLRHRPAGPAGGRLVFVGSRGAYRGEPTAPAYGASKAAVHSLAQSLAVALAPLGIAVAAVAPGFVHTERIQPKLDGPNGDALRGQSPFGRVAEPAEIAAAIAWLAGPDAIWASGAVLDLNGAAHLR